MKSISWCNLNTFKYDNKRKVEFYHEIGHGTDDDLSEKSPLSFSINFLIGS